MVNTRKFSEFVDGGDIDNNKTTVGLAAGENTKFNNPWTFLPPGTTGDRPTPAASMYFRIRFNTTLEVYEYYDPTTATWTQLSGGGTGTINPGVANDLAFYAANGTVISAIPGAINSVLVTNGLKVPSLSTTLPSGLHIPGATITASTAALLSGSIVAVPAAGTDITNKTYVDSLFGSGVTSITGTTNQVIASSPTGAVTLSLPQDIAIGSDVQFNSVHAGDMLYIGFTVMYQSSLETIVTFTPSLTNDHSLNIAQHPSIGGVVLESVDSGAGSSALILKSNDASVVVEAAPIASPGEAITFITGGDHFTVFNFPVTPATLRTVTFQDADGTVAYLSNIPAGTPSALTRVDDTNVTLTLGGTPATALLQAVSITAGWTGQLGLARGGSNASLVASNGGIVYSTASAFGILAGTATAGQMLQSGASTTPSWSTTTYPATNAINTIMYATSANVLGSISAANSAVLLTNASGVPAFSGTLTNGQIIIGSTGGTPAAATLTAGAGISISNAANSITIAGTGSGIGWTEVTGTTQAITADSGYIANNAGLVTLTLPVTAALGTAISIIGKGAGGWKIAQNASQIVQVGSQGSTAGVGGSVSSSNRYDSINLICTTANIVWTTLGAPQSASLTIV